MVEMLSGALLFSYFVAGIHFARFRKRTGDRLFLHFALAFWLFAVNQLATSIQVVANEANGYEYLLRVLGFIVIIVAIVDKNLVARK
jgi:dolichyl-phosphate-mannose--protein O-mannosyl transferase